MVSARGPLSLTDVLGMAFPAPDRGFSAAAEMELPVHMIPQTGEPRWVVLGDSRNATTVLRSWRPFEIGTRLRWAAIVSASSLGLLSRLPRVITARASIDASYWRDSLPGFQDDWVPVLYIGYPSHTRKIAVFFVGREEPRFKAVAKVPLLPLSRQAILNEAAILDVLAGADFVPATLFLDRERGIAAQSWLQGEPVSRKLTPEHLEFLCRLALPGAACTVSSQRASIACELDQADLPFDRSELARAQDHLDYDEPLPGFIEHRDFAPWNLKRLPNCRTGAIDWEWAAMRGLPCQDLFRYFYLQDALFFGPGDVWEVLPRNPLVRSYLRKFSIGPAALFALVMYYQLRVLVIDWQSGNQFLAEYAFRQIKALLKSERTVAVRA